MALTKPSQPIEPEVSFVVAFLSNADDARALVSPIVSVAETKKISVTEIIDVYKRQVTSCVLVFIVELIIH